jgi:uncharacterized pyridoxamine 5'-phosphate oxidase family protein
VVQSIATNPQQQSKVNDFAMELNAHDRLFAFGSVHPNAPDAIEELERISQAGLKGVKLHPEYQGFYADDEKMKPIYRKISDLGLITLFHAGTDIGFPPPYHAMPEHILGALRWLEGPVVAAHWGGAGCGPEVVEKLCGENLYFDLSFGYGVISKPVAQQMKANPKVEICGFVDGQWIRIAAEAVLDERIEPQAAMLDQYPNLKANYQPGDGNTEVYYLKNATAQICSFTEPPKEIKF